MDGQVEQDQAVQDGAPAAPAGPPVIQGGDSGTRAVTGLPRTTYLEGRAKQQQALHRGKAEQELEEPEQIDTGHMSAEAGSDPTSSRNSSSNRQERKQWLKPQRNSCQTVRWQASYSQQEDQQG